MKRYLFVVCLMIVSLFCNLLYSTGVGDTYRFVSYNGDTIDVMPYTLIEVNAAIEALDKKLISIEKEKVSSAELLQSEALIETAQMSAQEEFQKVLSMSNELSNAQVDDIRMEWMRQKAVLGKQQKIVTAQVKWCIESYEWLKIEKQRWLATKEALKSIEIAPEMTKRISSIIKVVETAEKDLLIQQKDALHLENKLTDILLSIDDSFIRISGNSNDVDSKVFKRNGAPVWVGQELMLEKGDVLNGFGRSVVRNMKLTKMFVVQNKPSVIKHLILFVIFVLLLFALKYQLKNLHIPLFSNELSVAKLVTENVLSTALLLTLIASVVVYYYIPSSVRQVIISCFVIVSVMIPHNQLEMRYRKYIFYIVILFIFNNIVSFVEPQHIMFRVFLMIEAILCFFIIFNSIRTNKDQFSSIEGVWWKAVWKSKYILLSLTIISIVANVLGYLSLASLLTKITTYTLLFGLILTVAQLIISGVLIIIMHTKIAFKSKLITNYHQLIKRRQSLVVQYVLIFFWVKATLNSVGYYDLVVNWLVNLLKTSWTIGTSNISLYGILTFLSIIAVSIILSKVVKQFLMVEIFPRVKLPRGIPGSTSMMISYLIGSIGIYIAIVSTGIDLNKFSLVVGALGVGIGFGLQNVVHNFISGLILAFERPIQVGDTVAVGTLTGLVKNIGIRSSIISTFDGSDVIVPNSNLISNEVINWTLSNQTRRRQIPVGVAYGTHPEAVLEVLRRVVRDHDQVLEYPLPQCLFDGFGDSSLNFRVLFWAPVDNALSIQSSLGIAIYDALELAGMQIPFPQRDLHIKSYEKIIEDKSDSK